jgi:hypothetical protein
MHSSYPVSSYVLPGLGEELQAVAAVLEEERIPGPRLHHEPLEFQADVLHRWWRCGRVGVGDDADTGIAHYRRLVEGAVPRSCVEVAKCRWPGRGPSAAGRGAAHTAGRSGVVASGFVDERLASGDGGSGDLGVG